MSKATNAPEPSELHPFGRPTTVRLSMTVLNNLDKIRDETAITRNGLIGLAISAMLDHVDRTGKLPCPKAKRRTRSLTRKRNRNRKGKYHVATV